MAQGLSNGCAGLLVFLCVSSMCVHTSQHWYKLEESQNGQSSGKITSVQEDPWTSALPKGDEWRGNRGSLANAQAQVHTHSHCEGADFRRPRRHRCLRFCILQINGQRSHLDSVEYAVLRTRQSSSSLPECQTQGSVQGVSMLYLLVRLQIGIWRRIGWQSSWNVLKRFRHLRRGDEGHAWRFAFKDATEPIIVSQYHQRDGNLSWLSAAHQEWNEWSQEGWHKPAMGDQGTALNQRTKFLEADNHSVRFKLDFKLAWHKV